MTRFRARSFHILVAVIVALGCAGFDVSSVEDRVVRVFKQGDGRLGIGTGFIVKDRNIIVTNHHVIRDGRRIFVGVLHDGKPVSRRARVLFVDKDKDLAVLQTDSDLPAGALRLASYEPAKGAAVTAIGFPGAADPRFPRKAFRGEFDREMFESTVSKGAVSRVRDRLGRWNARLIQHTTAINPGNSGGPLFDECGNVVGVNSFIRRKRSRNGRIVDVYQGLHYSVHAKEVIALMRRNGMDPGPAAETCAPETVSGDMPVIYMLFGATILALAITTIFAVRRKPAVLMVPLSKMGERTSLLLRRAGHNGSAEKGGNGAAQPAGPRPISGRDGAALPPDAAARIRLRPAAGGPAIELNEDQLARGLVVGRASASDVRIPHKSVSAEHARIWRGEDGGLNVRDLNSSNGTWSSRGRIEEGQLQHGDILRFGKIVYNVDTGPGIDEAVAVSASHKALRLCCVGPDNETLTLDMIPAVKRDEGEHAETEWHIGREPVVCDLVLKSPKVSGRHARISFLPGRGWRIEDLNSRNGTIVDGKRMVDESRTLAGARRVQIADFKLWFQPLE